MRTACDYATSALAIASSKSFVPSHTQLLYGFLPIFMER